MKTKSKYNENSRDLKTMSDQKAAVVHLLAQVRASWHNLGDHTVPPQELLCRQVTKHAYRTLAIHIFNAIEEQFPDDLWTALPDENNLTPQSSIGDHLTATRLLMGFSP